VRVRTNRYSISLPPGTKVEARVQADIVELCIKANAWRGMNALTAAIAEQCATMADTATKQRQTYLRYLEALLPVELEERDHKTIARRIKEARCRG
jgi:hypothetical protein